MMLSRALLEVLVPAPGPLPIQLADQQRKVGLETFFARTVVLGAAIGTARQARRADFLLSSLL